MEKVIYKVVYNRKKKLNAEGTAPIQIEAYLNRKRKYFSTNIYVKPSQWDSKKRKVKNHPNMKSLNLFIHAFVIELEYRELKAWQEGRIFLLNDLEDKTEQESFLSFSDFYKNETNLISIKESTKKNHLSTLNLLDLYKKDILFEELSYSFLCDFERFLLAKKLGQNTIAKHLKHIKRYINLAINKNLFEEQNNPFRKYKIKQVETQRISLTPEELEVLEQTNLEKHKYAEKCLDAFLFSCYTGLRYSDIIRIKHDDIISINQDFWLVFLSEKTGVELRIPLSLLFNGKALFILQKQKKNSPFIFNIPDNSNVNKQLSRICSQVGITKKVSFHSGRHTNASLLLYNGVNITTVKKLLGHKNIRTTQIYCNIMDVTIIRELERMNKFL